MLSLYQVACLWALNSQAIRLVIIVFLYLYLVCVNHRYNFSMVCVNWGYLLFYSRIFLGFLLSDSKSSIFPVFKSKLGAFSDLDDPLNSGISPYSHMLQK